MFNCSCNQLFVTSCTGIGRVLNLRFNPSFSQVLWDPPSTAGVLSNLYYHVTLINNEVIVSKITDNTYYPLPSLQPCQYYTANVTAFSSDYHGDSVVKKQRTPGGVCVHACVHVCVRACMRTCMHMCVCACMHVCVRA